MSDLDIYERGIQIDVFIIEPWQNSLLYERTYKMHHCAIFRSTPTVNDTNADIQTNKQTTRKCTITPNLFFHSLCAIMVAGFVCMGIPIWLPYHPLAPTLSSLQLSQRMCGREWSVGEKISEMSWLLKGQFTKKVEQVLEGECWFKSEYEWGCVCVCACVWGWRVMRPDQHDGKPSQLLTQTHQWEKKREEGGGLWG